MLLTVTTIFRMQHQREAHALHLDLYYLKSSFLWCLALKPPIKCKDKMKSILLKYDLHLGLRLDCSSCLHSQLVIQYKELQIPNHVIQEEFLNIYFDQFENSRSGNSGETWQLSCKTYILLYRKFRGFECLKSDKTIFQREPKLSAETGRLHSFILNVMKPELQDRKTKLCLLKHDSSWCFILLDFTPEIVTFSNYCGALY